MSLSSPRILGIDPGLRITGFGCVRCAGDESALVEGGVIRLDPSTPVADRLVELDSDLTELIGRLRPDVVAVEALFAHYKHPATAIIMGHARGVILLAVRKSGLSLAEYPPREVKKSLTGSGRASKEQVQRAVQTRLALATIPEPADVADAIAIALCAAGRHALTH